MVKNKDNVFYNSKSSLSCNKSLDSLFSSTDTSISTQYLLNVPTFNTSSRKNPYKKKSQPKSTVTARVRSILDGDDTISRPLLKTASSEEEQSFSSEPSAYTSTTTSQRTSSYNLRKKAVRSGETSDTSEDINYKKQKEFRGIISSQESSLENGSQPPAFSLQNQFEIQSQNSVDPSTFPISKIKAMLQQMSQDSSLSQSKIATEAISDIFRECSNLENLQNQYRFRQSRVEKDILDIKSATKRSNFVFASLQSQPTLYQKESTMSSVSEDPSVLDPPTLDEYAKNMLPESRFKLLNYALSDEDTFLSQPETLTDTSPQYCDLEAESEDSMSTCNVAIPSSPTKDHINVSMTHAESYKESLQHISPFLPSMQTQDSLVLQAQAPEPSPSQAPPVPNLDDEPPSTAHLSRTPSLISHRSFDSPRFKQDTDIRFMHQNCRGAFPVGTPQNEHYVPCMLSFRNMLADAVLLSETNTDWKVHDNMYNAQLLNKALWKPHPTRTTVSSCKWDNVERSSFQTGGVLSLFLNTLPARIIKSESDAYGRWTKTTIQLKKRTLSVYNIYRTHSKTLETAGLDTPWMQQRTAIKADTSKEENPREKHMTDLLMQVEIDACANNLSLLMGDFNEDLGDNEENGLHLLDASPHLVNAFEHFNGNVPSSRKNNRSICHIYVSHLLLPEVSKIGICTDNDGFDSSDHVPIFVDFKSSLFLSNMKVAPHSARILQMYDTISVEAYVQDVLKNMSSQNIQNRLKKLREKIDIEGFNDNAAATLEKLDDQITEIRLLSEKRLLRPSTAFKHTDVAKEQVVKIRLLEKLRKLHQKNQDCTSTIQRLEQYEYIMEITPNNINQLITEERQSLRQIQEDIEIHREEYLDKLREHYSSQQQKEKAVVVTEMKNREKQKRAWNKIAFVTKSRSNGVSRLGIPQGMESATTKEIWDYLQDPDVKPTWVYITDEKEIENRLVQWQHLHYSQASETPFASKEWFRKVDVNNVNEDEIHAVLNNTLNVTSLHPTSRRLMKELADNILPNMPSSKTNITTTKYRSFYKKTSEKTSSSPSGLHMGHWKASATNDELSSILVGILNIAVSNSYVLRRWKKVIGILLEKKAGHPTIHKFRTIHLIESDLNFIMRSVWGREVMSWAEKNNALNDNQYGGRKGVMAQSAALNKTLTCDVIRYYAEDASLIDNDAQACYDRIVPVFLSYALLRLGMPLYLVKFQCMWLRTAEYELKLPSQTSKPYKSTSKEPLYGTGQGTGWSPPSWTSISDLISRVMDKEAPGIKLVHPNQTFLQRVIDAFVDDVNSGLTKDGLEDFIEHTDKFLKKHNNILQQTKANMQLYSQLLFTTGGRLALHKCAIYLIVTEWKNGVRSLKNTANTNPPVKIQQGFDQQLQQVKLENPTSSRRMLGVYISPSGDNSEQYRILRHKALTWKARMNSQFLNSHEVWMAYKQGIMKSLEYPVGCSYLQEYQCDQIQSPALTTTLTKNGLVSTMARDIVFGPHRYGGLGLTSLYSTMGIQQIEMTIGHIRKNDKTGKIITIAIGCLQQEVGTITPVLEQPYEKFHMISTPSWVHQLWKFLNNIDGTIRIRNVWTPKMSFTKDVNISEAVSTMDLSAEAKYNINICRLFKRCYSIGDLLQPDGKKLIPGALSLRHRGFHLDKFPKVEVPSKFENLWQFTIRHIMSTTMNGKALGTMHSFRAREWLMDDTGSFLIQQCYKKVSILYLRQKEGLFSSSPSSLKVPIIPKFAVHVVQRGKTFILKSAKEITNNLKSSHRDRIFPQRSLFTTFRKYIDSLPPVYKRNLGMLKGCSFSRILADHLRKGEIIAVGDASVDKKRGSHGYIIETTNEKWRMSGKAPVDSDPDDMSSNRAEGCSVVAMLTLLVAIYKYHNLDSGEVEIFCDNAEALRKKSYAKMTYTKIVERDSDIKMEITALLQMTNLKVRFQHVKSHADDAVAFDYDSAPQPTKRNIDMDTVAKQFLANPPSELHPNAKPRMLYHQKIALYLHGTLITGDIRKQIKLYHKGPQMEKRISKMLRISRQSLQKIEWEGMETAYSNLQDHEKSSKTKIIHDYLPTRHLLSKRNCPNSSICPNCQKTPETFLHIFQCSHRPAHSAHNAAIKKLRNSLRRTKTHILIINAFDVFLSQVRKKLKPKYVVPALGSKRKINIVQQVFDQQVSLGALSLHKGFLSRNWMLAQNVCDDKKDVEHKNLHWTKNVIRALWEYSQDMWLHRCKQSNLMNKDDPDNLTHNEILFALRQYLRLDRKELSVAEKKLHLNVTRSIKTAHTKTLIRWLKLLKKERELTIRMKRNERRSSGRTQTITRFLSKI